MVMTSTVCLTVLILAREMSGLVRCEACCWERAYAKLLLLTGCGVWWWGANLWAGADDELRHIVVGSVTSWRSWRPIGRDPPLTPNRTVSMSPLRQFPFH